MAVQIRYTRRDRVLLALGAGPMTHTELARRIDRSVSGTLADLVAASLVHCIQHEYFLTDAGQQARRALRTESHA